MAEQKDPLKITLAEAAELYNQEIGTSKITSFGGKAKFSKYGNIALVDAFKGSKGNRIIDEILAQSDTPGTFNKMIDNLRLISQPVRRRISLASPNDLSLNTLPGLEAKDEQTKIVFGERKVAEGAAEIAILTDNRQGWKEFFDQIDKIADDPKHPKQALANAFRISYYTGPRPNLIAGLQGSEYLIDQGAIFVVPQTKTVGAKKDQETRKGASKGKTSFKGKATPYTVPLSENAHAYLQQQLKINANDPDIKAYIEEQRKKGKAPIFVQKTVDKNGKVKVSTIDATAISDMLSEIKTSTPIIIDNQSGKEFNSLNPAEKTKTGKFGSGLARNIHASIALNELDEPDKLIDFLHARSETSGTKGRGQTKKMKYALRPRGRFTPGERDGQQRIGNWINEVQGKDASAIPDVENRVTSANYALKNFFDKPVSTASVAGDIDEQKNVINKVISGEIQLDDMDQIREKRRSKKVSKKNVLGTAALIAGTTSSSDAAANFVGELVMDEVLDGATLKLLQAAGLPATVANPVGLAATTLATMTTTMDPEGEADFGKHDRYAEMLGVSKNQIRFLPPDKFRKLDETFKKHFFKKDVLEPEIQQTKGRELRSLTDQMNELDTKNNTTPSLLLDDGSTSINQGENYATR